MKNNHPLHVPALFLHIQKTAGSSIVHAATQHYGASLTSHGELWGRSPESVQNIEFISGHVGYDYSKSLLPNRFSFTFLRDPIERVLSMYYFCRDRDPRLFTIYQRANALDLNAFLRAAVADPWIKKNIWNNQVWQLAHGYAHLDNRTISDFDEEELLDLAIEHLDDITYVGFTETFDADCRFIFSKLEIPLLGDVPEVNVNGDRPMGQNISEENINLVRSITKLDQRLYDFCQSKYSRRRSHAIDSLES